MMYNRTFHPRVKGLVLSIAHLSLISGGLTSRTLSNYQNEGGHHTVAAPLLFTHALNLACEWQSFKKKDIGDHY